MSGLLAILFTTTMVHTPNKEEIKEVIPQSTSGMPLFNICMKVVKFQQKRIFLNRCVKQNVLLRSQLKKGVDYDLLLTQQARNISNSLKELNKFISVNQSKITQYLSDIEKKSLKKIERSFRYEYIKKFNWIHETSSFHFEKQTNNQKEN